MSSATFFGHRRFGYAPFKDKIERSMVDLIEHCGVTEFYNGYRGDFDLLCAEIIYELKDRYPTIKNILVLSYHPKPEFKLPPFFDESVYLLEKPVPPKFAISYTNQCIVDRVDIIISGVRYDWGGAWTACEYARRKKKRIIKIFEL